MKISIKNGAVTLAGNNILEQIDFEIKDNEHIAIVGRNGAGKTTFLKALIDPDLLEEGIGEEKLQITKIGNPHIGYLKQIEFDDESVTLLSEIRSSFSSLVAMEEKLNRYVEMINKKTDDKLINEYTNLQEQFKLLGGYSYQKEYEVMIHKFGFNESDKEKAISTFSGGQKTKIALMKLLLSKPDVLLLDEPTNHLDISTIEWLEEYLRKYKGSFIVVSHDRMFINNTCSIIYDIEYGKMSRYVGNYEFYEREKQRRYERMLSDYEFQQKEIKRLTAIYERFRFKPSKAGLAMSRLHQLEKMEIIEKPNKIDMNTFKTNLKEMETSVKTVLTAEDLQIGYDIPLATLNLSITRGKKIGIIGANGIGKSTLLKTLHGIIEPISGSVSYGLRVNPGYFDQSLAFLSKDHTVLEEFRNFHPELEETKCRQALGSFLFKGEDVYKSLSVLSGGEKVRLQLCKILYNKPNFLILDEPTNHMDIVGKEHLENILEEYEGTLIFVSHDRYFVKKIANQLLVFDANGTTFYPYGYEEYKRGQENKEEKQPEPREKKQKKEPSQEVKSPSVNLYTLRKEVNKLEQEIIRLETKKEEYNQEFLKNDVINDYQKANALQEKIKELETSLTLNYQKWEELTDLILTSKKDAN